MRSQHTPGELAGEVAGAARCQETSGSWASEVCIKLCRAPPMDPRDLSSSVLAVDVRQDTPNILV